MGAASLPKWTNVRLGDVASVSRGASPRPISSSRWFDDSSTVGWVRIADLGRSDGLVLRDTTQRLSPDGIARSRYLPPGSLILSIAATVGVPIITGIPTCIHDGFVAIERLKGIDQGYLLYALKSLEHDLRAAGQTGSQANVNSTIVRELRLELPPLREQEQIASVLADIDHLISILHRLIAKKEAIKQGMLQELLSGRTRLPGFVDEWEVKPLGRIVQLRKERIDPRLDGEREYCVELEHVGRGTGRLIGSTTASPGASLKSVFYPGDVLFGKLRAYLKKYWLATRHGVCSTEFWVLAARSAEVLPSYLVQLVSTDNVAEAAGTSYGTHMPRSDWSVVRNLEVSLPPIEEQAVIADALADMDAEMLALEAKIAKTRLVKEGMMQSLLSGRIRLAHDEAVA